MKQGKASQSIVAGTKPTTIAKAVSPAGVSQIGLAQGVRPTSVYEGRGLEAPMKSTTTHVKGSQGRH